jgi:two-component system sensor histidine kinase CpxA
VRSLFLKIFLTYWLAQALFMLLAVLVTLSLQPPGEIANLQAMQAKYLTEAVQEYHAGGESGARTYLRSVRDAQRVWIFIFDDQGHDLLGRRPPDWIEKVERGETATADRLWGRLGAMQFLRHTMTAADGRRYTIVMQLPPDQHSVFGPNGVPGLGLFIALLSSGLVCYFLAKYLTAPVLRLRAAAQRLADGDLSARAGSSSLRRKDELAQLVQDFDRMAERIESLVNAQGRLLKDISHELRSPLARLTVALALARQRSGDEAAGILDRMELEASRLNEMIGRLLTLSRLEGGRDSLRESPVRLGELIREIAKDASFEAQEKNCSVECSISSEAVLMGDASLLHSAIENAVRNATRYTADGTNVQVSLRVRNQEAKSGAAVREAIVQVTDSGPGVPEDALDKMFLPFYRVDDARLRGTGGVGLGLAITKRAIELHGGTVRAENRLEGGLVVEFRLPAMAAVEDLEELVPPAADSSPAPVPTAGR